MENKPNTENAEVAMIRAALEIASSKSNGATPAYYQDLITRFPEAYKTISDAVKAARQEQSPPTGS